MGIVLDFIRPRDAQRRAIADALREDRKLIVADFRALAGEFTKQGNGDFATAFTMAAERVAQVRHRRKVEGRP